MGVAAVSSFGTSAQVLTTLPARSLKEPLNVATATVFSGPINVCWEFDDRDAEKVVVRQAIADTWENGPARFVGWDRCAAAGANLRISIADDANANPHSVGLGRQVDRKAPGMVLNYDFRHWSRSCSISDATRLQCIRAVAVHEFGHALGFSHEQNRRDSTCSDLPQGANGDISSHDGALKC